MQNIIKNKLLSCIVFLALGVVTIILRDKTADLFVYILGGVLLLGALVRFIAYFTTKKEDRVPLSLVLGVASAAIGLIFVLAPAVITNIIAYVFGAVLICNSLLDLVIAIRLPSGKTLAVLLALLGIVLGILIIIMPGPFKTFATILLGAAMIYEAVVGIVTVIFARKVAKSNLLNK